jgi:hypothetical protein
LVSTAAGCGVTGVAAADALAFGLEEATVADAPGFDAIESSVPDFTRRKNALYVSTKQEIVHVS